MQQALEDVHIIFLVLFVFILCLKIQSPMNNNNLLDDYSQGSSKPIERIGFGTRLGAHLLDGLFMVIFIWLVAYVVALLFVSSVSTAAANNDDLAVANSFLSLIINMIYGIVLGASLYTLIEVFTGASFGKMILGVKIAQPNGEAAPMSAMLMRWALKNITLIFLILFALTHAEVLLQLNSLGQLFILVSCLMALRESKQALHDQLAGTVVVRR